MNAIYPEAHLTAFEPHPRHVAMLQHHLELNHQARHVTVHLAAATTDRGAFLSDQGMRSTHFSQRRSGVLTEATGVDASSLYGERVDDLARISTLPAPMRRDLAASHTVGLPQLACRYESSDGTKRYLLELEDRRTIEAVLMPEPARDTICISTQG